MIVCEWLIIVCVTRSDEFAETMSANVRRRLKENLCTMPFHWSTFCRVSVYTTWLEVPGRVLIWCLSGKSKFCKCVIRKAGKCYVVYMKEYTNLVKKSAGLLIPIGDYTQSIVSTRSARWNMVRSSSTSRLPSCTTSIREHYMEMNYERNWNNENSCAKPTENLGLSRRNCLIKQLKAKVAVWPSGQLVTFCDYILYRTD